MINFHAKAADIITYLNDISLILVITAITSVFMGLQKIRDSYHQKSFSQIIFNIVWSSGIGVGLTTIVLGVLDYLVPDISVSILIGTAVYIGMFGMKGIDYLIRKKLKTDKGILDLMDRDLLNTHLCNLSIEEQMKHRQQCPLQHLDKEIGKNTRSNHE